MAKRPHNTQSADSYDPTSATQHNAADISGAHALLATDAPWRRLLMESFGDLARQLQRTEDKERRRRFRPYRERLDSASVTALNQFGDEISKDLEGIREALQVVFDKGVTSTVDSLGDILADEAFSG